jgi:glycerophosphoryl diester phosphodiesterase
MREHEFPYKALPLNLGHRGAPKVAPENTLASFELARSVGADGVELDVQLSADGGLVVMHDSRVERTTNGQGALKALTMAQIKELDAGVAFAPKYTGERVPSLSEVLDWAGQTMLLNIELKSMSMRGDGLEAKVIALVRQCGLQGRVILSSFNPWSLVRARQTAPEISRGLLYSPGLPLPLRRAWLRPMAGPNALHPHWTMVNDPYLNWARKKGYRVNVWTADEPHDLQHLIDLRVDTIITNRPDRLAALLMRP